MKQLLLIATFILGSFFVVNAQTNPNRVYVNGYTKSNGTYVNGYYRTAPNSTINDNFSTYPNVNPYTGKTGTVRPSYSSGSSTYNSNSYSYPTYNSSPSNLNYNWSRIVR